MLFFAYRGTMIANFANTEVLMLKRYIGDRAFYRHVLGIAIPIIIQNGITNFVSLLDNIMVGQVGTLQMSGVSIANQLLLVFNLCIFGASAGAGIFTAQFFGSRNTEGIRHTFRFKFLCALVLSLVGLGIFLFGGNALIRLYLRGEGAPADAALTLGYGMSYLKLMLWGLLPFALSNIYAGTLRETGQTVVPMIGGVTAVCVNLVLNWVLIFGHLGLPALGVRGAAIATVISRYVELAIVAGWTHCSSHRNEFIRGVYRSMHIPSTLARSILRKGMPLLVNEFLWSSGIAVMAQCYSTCGLEVVPALNIATTIQNLANVVSMAMGNAVGILMGQMLGSGKSEEAVRDANRKLIALTVLSGVVFGGLLLTISDLFPMIYNTTDAVRSLSGNMIRIIAVMMPFGAFTLSCYFTLRSGGQALITFLFDGCYLWVCPVLLAFCLSRFTAIGIIPLFTVCQIADVARCTLGAYMLKKGSWIRNLTE